MQSEQKNNIRYLHVSALNKYIEYLIQNDRHLSRVYLEGELSNVTLHKSGHMYFTVKDTSSTLRGVMFRKDAEKLSFEPKEGMLVQMFGSISVYPKTGTYQYIASELQEKGIGSFYEQYEKLRKKLQEEGIFEKTIKHPLPKFPEHIVVITSTTGAAVYDMVKTIHRRYHLAQITIVQATVQGAESPRSLIVALQTAYSLLPDVILFGRGGGSIEDLWSFNDEHVVRYVAASPVPIITAVGHESDTTLVDFAGSIRASTPTAAAELATPEFTKETLMKIDTKLGQAFETYLLQKKTQLLQMKHHPALIEVQHVLRMKRRGLETYAHFLKHYQKHFLHDERRLVFEQKRLLYTHFQNKLLRDRTMFEAQERLLRSVHPLKSLERGYAALFISEETETKKRTYVHRATELHTGMNVHLELHDGIARACIEDIYYEGEKHE